MTKQKAGEITFFETALSRGKHKIEAKVKDRDDNEIIGQDSPASGTVAEVHTFTYMRVETPGPGSSCWLQVGGTWYKLC